MFEIIHLNLQPHLPGINELTYSNPITSHWNLKVITMILLLSWQVVGAATLVPIHYNEMDK